MMMMPNMMNMPGMGNNVFFSFDTISGRFDHSPINPIQLGASANQVEAALTEIEETQEVQEIKQVFKDADGLSKYQLLGFIFFFCFIGIICFCIMMCKTSSLNKRLSQKLRELKAKADQILHKYNQNFNADGKHASTKMNDMFQVSPLSSRAFANQYFSVSISLSPPQQQQQQQQQMYQLNQMMQNQQQPFNQFM